MIDANLAAAIQSLAQIASAQNPKQATVETVPNLTTVDTIPGPQSVQVMQPVQPMRTGNPFPVPVLTPDFAATIAGAIQSKPATSEKDPALAALVGVMQSIADNQQQQVKNQKLEWAIMNANLGSFKYFQKDNSEHAIDSTVFVKTVLLSFRRGVGQYITNRSMERYHFHADKTPIDAGEQRFRDALVSQVHDLVGSRPRVALAGNGYAIYFS